MKCDILREQDSSLRCSNNHIPLRGGQQATIYYDRRRCDTEKGIEKRMDVGGDAHCEIKKKEVVTYAQNER